MSFSIQSTDLDDYILPSQTCIKVEEPVDKGKRKHIVLDAPQGKVEKASISMADCLACSGCVTSAETVLINAQSVDEFRLLRDAARLTVVSVAPQCVASLAARFHLSIEDTAAKLWSGLRLQGVHVVVDTAFARDLALWETLDELSSRRTAASGLPLLASSCPGFVCFAETSQPTLLPHIAHSKSPQQMMGTLVKGVLAKRLGVEPSKIFHAALMPCFDKKLEASRAEFDRQVDVVLATNELPKLLGDAFDAFTALDKGKASADERSISYATDDTLLRASTAGGSGGYAEFVLTQLAPSAEALARVVWTPANKRRPTTDFQVAELADDDGKVIVRVGIINGFQNIMTLVKWLKRWPKAVPRLDFVEVMACPSGCLNGGGQLRLDSGTLDERRALLESVKQRYSGISVDPRLSVDVSKKTWEEWKSMEGERVPDKGDGDATTFKAGALRTRYFKREKEENGLAIKW